MTVFIEDDAPVIVQGMTGHQGMTHTARMLKAGTNIVGGVNPRKAGTTVPFTMEDGTVRDIPVFATCQEAKAATGAVASVVFVPPKFAKGAVVEAVEADSTSLSSSPKAFPSRIAPISWNSPCATACASSARIARV